MRRALHQHAGASGFIRGGVDELDLPIDSDVDVSLVPDVPHRCDATVYEGMTRLTDATETEAAGARCVILSELPIAEVVAKLSELQEQFPDAQVRRGRANRWELWAPEAAD